MHELNETSENLMEPYMQEELFSSQLGFHVSQPVLPGSERAQQMTVGSGRKLLGLWQKHNRHGQSLKTLSEYLVLKKDWYSRICFLKWKVKGTPYNRILYQLAPSVPSTGDIESGLLRSPSSQEPGVKNERLITKDGKPAKVGERAYETRPFCRLLFQYGFSTFGILYQDKLLGNFHTFL